MLKVTAIAAAIALLCLGSLAQAAITIDTVAVGNAGNAADMRLQSDGTSGYGSVANNYNIGKYEVTAGQYTAFLNAVAATDTYGLYNTNMDTAVVSHGCNIKRTGTSGNYSYNVASDWANRPVNMVGFWDSCRFANWLGNGQKTGAQDASTTERGAYTLDGYTGYDGRTISRNAGATWAVTSEGEWYKAAYYKGGGTNAGYWLYPTQSDSMPGRDLNDASGNNANYGDNPYPIQSPYYTTVVGEFQNSDSAYGTFDQGGNVWEWSETIHYISGSVAARIGRGGSFLDNSNGYCLQSSNRNSTYPAHEWDTGFRVVQVAPVPEPSSIIALLGGLVGLLGMRRRRG